MKQLYLRYIRSLYFSRRFYWLLAAIVFLFLLGFFWSFVYVAARFLLAFFAVIMLLDYVILFLTRKTIQAQRILPDKFSNGDENTVGILLKSSYPFQATLEIIDEIPDQFQERNFRLYTTVTEGEEKELQYKLRPTERGEYLFYLVNVFVKSPLALIVRRIQGGEEQMVKVLPSYLALRQFELMAWSNKLADNGSRRIRKIGHSTEFEQIKEYITGDDIRNINWKATARKGQLMVNTYTDERSQQVYCFIDKGRVMKMPFEGMTLLDYAINATLVLSRVALIRQDRAGLVTFAENIGHFLPADRKASQMTTILEALYNQDTRFLETDYEKLYALVRTRITQRSLIVLFTNFESMSGLQRQLPYLRSIARNHLVLVVFFENTELREMREAPAESVEALYMKTIAERFAYEKRLMVKELQQVGITTILTAPSQLTVDTVNRYIEIKARQAI